MISQRAETPHDSKCEEEEISVVASTDVRADLATAEIPSFSDTKERRREEERGEV